MLGSGRLFGWSGVFVVAGGGGVATSPAALRERVVLGTPPFSCSHFRGVEGLLSPFFSLEAHWRSRSGQHISISTRFNAMLLSSALLGKPALLLFHVAPAAHA